MRKLKETISCRYCKTRKPRDEFYKCKSSGTHLNPRCKDCDKKHNNKKRRGYTIHKKCLEFLGNKCKRCGFSDIRALQIDHVNGGGKKEIKSFSGWRPYYRAVLADTTGKYQCLCANCNWIKRHENKEGMRE